MNGGDFYFWWFMGSLCLGAACILWYLINSFRRKKEPGEKITMRDHRLKQDYEE